MKIKTVIECTYEVPDEVYDLLDRDDVGIAIQNGDIKMIHTSYVITDENGKVLEDDVIDQEVIDDVNETLKTTEG